MGGRRATSGNSFLMRRSEAGEGSECSVSLLLNKKRCDNTVKQGHNLQEKPYTKVGMLQGF